MTLATVIHYVLLALFAYRVQRIIVQDDWPISRWFRRSVKSHYGVESSIYDFITCPWCIGFWITVAIVANDWYRPIPTVILLIGAISTIVGLIGNAD